MTERHAQCGRTFVHAPHETTEGPCPGLAPLDPPLIARRDVPRPLDPSYAGQRRAEPGMMGEFAAAEPDPIRAWMLSYPAENTAGPGWGDDDDVEAGRCCPTCRASLTDHNVAVREGGRLQGVRDGLDALERAVTDPVRPLSKVGVFIPDGITPTVETVRDAIGLRTDPWAEPEGTYDVGTLRAGLRAIAADATAREDHHTAHLAHAFLSGDPVSPEVDHDLDLDRLDVEPQGIRYLALKLASGQRVTTIDLVKAADSVRREVRA